MKIPVLALIVASIFLFAAHETNAAFSTGDCVARTDPKDFYILNKGIVTKEEKGADGFAFYTFTDRRPDGSVAEDRVPFELLEDCSPEQTPPTEPVSPRHDPIPADINEFPPTFSWDSRGAQSFYLRIEKNGIPLKEYELLSSSSFFPHKDFEKLLLPQKTFRQYSQECGVVKGLVCSIFDIDAHIRSQQTIMWQVKFCSDPAGADCGPYSAPWHFAYLPAPPTTLQPSSSTSIPVTLQWNKAPGAESYRILSVEPSWMFDPDEFSDVLDDLHFSSIWKHAYTTLSEDGVSYNRTEEAPTSYTDNTCFFTRDQEYPWGVASCLDEKGQICGKENEASFFTNGGIEPVFQFTNPSLLSPEVTVNPDGTQRIPLASSRTILDWEGPQCAFKYLIQISPQDDPETPTISGYTPTAGISVLRLNENILNEADAKPLLTSFWGNPENLDRVFQWKVLPCWPDAGSDFGVGQLVPRCTTLEELDPKWSNTLLFKTVGAPPVPSSPSDQTVPSAFALRWSSAPEVEVYSYEISSSPLQQPNGMFTISAASGISTSTSPAISFAPDNDIRPNREYWWHVRTCVDREGTACGPWSGTLTFRTAPLHTPTALIGLNDDGTIYLPGSVGWTSDPGAGAYQYRVQYTNTLFTQSGVTKEETNPLCKELEGSFVLPKGGIPPFPVTRSSGAYLTFECLGEYRISVRSCADTACAHDTDSSAISPWSAFASSPFALSVASPVFAAIEGDPSAWKFIVAETPPTPFRGLVPCGRYADILKTPYDESESCQLKHMLFLVQDITDFLLWRMSIFILAVFIALGAISTFVSFGNASVAENIRKIFWAFLKGFLILLFAWTLINVVLGTLGFRIEFFGRWWELPF